MKLTTGLLALLALACLPCPTFAGENRVERLPESDTLTTDETRAPLERERRVSQPAADSITTTIKDETPDSRVSIPSTSADDVVYAGTDPTGYFHLNQDELCPTNPNACGTTSLSMILAANDCIEWTLEAGRRVDEAVRPWGGFSAPRDLQDYAEDLGLESSAVNGASFARLERALANGNSVMAMVDGGGAPHWIVVLGVETNVETGEETLVVADPGNHGVGRISRAEFERKWDAPMKSSSGGFLSDTLGYHNYFLAFNRDGLKLPNSGTLGITSTEVAADGLTDVTNSWSQLKDGQVITAATGLVGGVVKVVASLPGLIGSAASVAGDRVLGWAGDKSTQGGFLNTLGAVGGYVLGGTLKVAGAVLGVAGTVVSAVGNVVGGVVKSVGRFVGRLFHR